MMGPDTSRLRQLYGSARRAIPDPVRRVVRRTRRAATYLPRHLLGSITSVATDAPAVAFTFDDGPDPHSTPRFLELLERYGARGTFFLLGESAERYPRLVARIVEAGHVVGNHSFSHASFPAITERERRDQIEQCSRAIGNPAVKLFRPPYGNLTLSARLTPLRLGWEVVTWNISGTDWRGEDADYISGRILKDLRPGSIVLLHDTLHHYEDERYVSREASLEALERVLKLSADKYSFVTVPELLRLGRPQRELWAQPAKADYLAALKSSETDNA